MANMEDLAFKALTAIKGGTPTETKLKQLAVLKAEIKHRHCPEPAVAPLFDVVRASISTPLLTTAGFSILVHLMKRLQVQGNNSLLQIQGVKTYPCLLERLADQREPARNRAIQALTEFHAISAPDVEQFVRDKTLTCRSPKAKESGMHWVTTTRKEKNIPFRAFVPNIVDCLEDADGSVRSTAQATLVELFQNAGPRGMNDLQKHLQQRNVRKTIVEHILSQIGIGASSEVEAPTPVRTHDSETSKQTQSFNGSTANDPPLDAPPMSVSEQEAVQLDPVYIQSSRDLEDTFREMQPWFEGKESEGNWLRREKSILKLRKITKGNAPQDFTTLYLSCIKGLLDDILKTVNSLRTTVSTIGCHLVQDIARVAGSGLDNMVEILLQNLIKLCANTKKITAAKANETASAIMANVSYHVRLTQHIYAACQDKNVQPRNFATGWLKTIITKHGPHKSVIEHGGGLELIEKCVKLGLADRDKGVRDGMRPTFWMFARRWPDRSEVLMSALDNVQQKLLIEDSSNPNPQQAVSHTATAGGKPTFSKSTNAMSTRPSIKETIAAQKKAKAAGWNLPERPSSAEPSTSPKKATVQPSAGRPGTAMASAARNVSNASVGTLSSAPVRPRRRADVVRPATADPYSTRKPTRTETPPRSPAVSPVKRVKTPARPASSAKLAPTKVDSPASSKANSPKKSGIAQGINHFDSHNVTIQPEPSPTKAAEDFTMVLPNFKASKSDDPNISPEFVNEDPFMPGASNEMSTSASPKKISGLTGPTSPNHRGGGIPRLSPTKLAGEFGRLSIDEKAQRISMSPRTIGSRKEALTPKNSVAQDQKPLQVYEDPVRLPNNGSPYPSPLPLTHVPRALEELPVNEPSKQRGVFDHQLLAEEPKYLDYHQNWLAMESQERQLASTSENTENPALARKILNSGIDRVRARTLDVHGFRKLQILIRSSGDSIWEGGYKFDELLLPLLDYLESPNDEPTPRSAKAQDLKTQVLVTVRSLLQHQPDYFSGYYPRAISAVLATRKQYTSTSHIVCGLEDTAEGIIEKCDPVKCIDAVLDLLETERSEGAETMGLYVLAGLLRRGQEKGCKLQLSSQQEERLGRMGARGLADTNPDIRRAVIDFVLELRDSMDQDRFWGLVAGGRDDHRSLITYYLARKRATVQ